MMLDIVLVITAPIRVSAKDTGRVVLMVGTRLDVGDYMVNCEDEIQVSDEQWVHCIISGRVHRNPHIWTSFEVAHVFPLEKESLWIQFNYGRWTTDMDDTNGVSRSTRCRMGFYFNRTSTSCLINT